MKFIHLSGDMLDFLSGNPLLLSVLGFFLGACCMHYWVTGRAPQTPSPRVRLEAKTRREIPRS